MTDDMDEQTRIRNIIVLRDVISRMAPNDAASVLLELCKRDQGVWIEPSASVPGLHVVSILGVSATGYTPEIVAVNWIRVAHQSGLD